MRVVGTTLKFWRVKTHVWHDIFLNSSMERIGFWLRELLLGWQVITVNPGILFCYNSQEEVLVISDFMQWFSPINSHCCCFCLSVINKGTNFVDICCLLQFFMIHWHVPSESPNLIASTKSDWVIHHLWFSELCQCFPMCKLWRDGWSSYSFQMNSPHV